MFKPYSESFKKFNTRYFKIMIKEVDRNQFRDASGEPLFPYYWIKDSARISPVPIDSMLIWYLRRFADRHDAEEVQNELAAKKKVAEEVRFQMEALTLEHSKCEKTQADLLKKFEGACVEVATLTQKLKEL